VVAVFRVVPAMFPAVLAVFHVVPAFRWA